MQPHCKQLRRIADEYFREHESARDDVIKAFYAYHADAEKRLDTHNFAASGRDAACLRCKRTREQVRHDDLPASCQSEFGGDKAERIILEEERKALALRDRAEKDVPKTIAKHGLSGETLAMLYHTYGYDPETVASIVFVPTQTIAGYHAMMETERARSRAAQKKEVITVRAATA